MQLETQGGLEVTVPDDTSVEDLQRLAPLIENQFEAGSIPYWQAVISEWSRSKGWEAQFSDTPEKICLMHSELSEALECYRDHMRANEVIYVRDKNDQLKPEGISMEMADAVIRILHYCSDNGIDLEEAIRIKMAFNSSRPMRHGGKKV